MPEIEITGVIEVGTSESEAYAEVMEKLEDLDETLDGLSTNAITVNGEFDDTLGWWGQVHGGDKFDDTIIMHKRDLVENFDNKEVSPFMATQTVVDYSDNVGHNFTRMCNAYHELIGDGSVIASDDHHTPNFTAMGATCYNKFKGNVGMCAVIGRIDDVAYTDEELGIEENDTKGTTGMGSSKSCAGGFMVTRRSNYSQGRHSASYSIGLETYALNAAEEDGILGTEGYASNDDFHRHRTWINGYHCVGGGRRPATDGILINGFTVTVPIDANGKTTSDRNAVKKVTMHNGFLNGITIGGSSMAVRHIVKVTNAKGDVLSGYTTDGNSTETVGINTSSWSNSEGKNYGFYLLKHGYSGRILHSRGSALFEAPAFKFLNSNGSMPFAISCVNEYTYKDEQQVEHTAHGTPYLDFKIGSDSDFYNNSIPLERPTDTTRARIGYLSSTNSLNVSSDGAIKFITSRNFSDSEAETLDFTMSNNGFYPSETVNLGSQNYFWENIFARKGAVNVADDEKYRDTTTVERPSTAGDTPTEAEKLLTAWGNVKYKVFKFLDTNSKKHIGLSAQDISDAFTAQGLTANSYGLYWANTNGNTTDYGVRYNECLAMECAYLRDQLNSVKARLTALENA